MLKLCPTARGCSRQTRTASTMSSTKHHARICEPSPRTVRSLPASAASMKARIGPPPACPGPEEGPDRPHADLPGPVDVEGTHGHGRGLELVVVGVRHVLACELGDRVR